MVKKQKWSKSIKYLGVRIDDKLKFTQNTREITTRIRSVSPALYPMLCHQSPIAINTKLSIVQMYVTSILMYAGPAWGALISESHCNRIDAVQNIAFRTITEHPCFLKNTVLHQSFCCKSIKQLILSHSHNMFHKNITSQFPHIQTLGLTQALVEWKRTRPFLLLEIN